MLDELFWRSMSELFKYSQKVRDELFRFEIFEKFILMWKWKKDNNWQILDELFWRSMRWII